MLLANCMSAAINIVSGIEVNTIIQSALQTLITIEM